MSLTYRELRDYDPRRRLVELFIGEGRHVNPPDPRILISEDGTEALCGFVNARLDHVLPPMSQMALLTEALDSLRRIAPLLPAGDFARADHLQGAILHLDGVRAALARHLPEVVRC